MNKLDQLKSMTDVVADTGDIEAIKRFRPLDATTNPSLLLKASQLPHYDTLINEAVRWAAAKDVDSQEQSALCSDRLATHIGTEILEIVPGRISTEVDARLSYDTDATLERARRLIRFYEERSIGRERVLIKIASTWEGIKAAEVLEQEGIHCNLTLLFGFEQAQACADAGVTLISPFVGRILDWHLANGDQQTFTPDQDPGVKSVHRIFNHYKQCGYHTVVMGASFRNQGQIEALAGCDRLTISPELLQGLEADTGEMPQRLSSNDQQTEGERTGIAEVDFRLALNQDAMAYEKLGDGIRRFIQDQQTLEALLLERAKLAEKIT